MAVVSDVHANVQAFEAVLEAVAASDAHELWCLGDLVGYGANPDACVALARRHVAVCLAGNHDMAVTGELALEDFTRGAAIAVQWTREVIDPANLAYLAELAPKAREDSLGLYHASPRDPVWEYVTSALQAELCLDAQSDRVCLIGHSHVASAFVRREGETTTGEPRRDGAELDIATDEWLLNPGSVGQPRDGDPRAAWLLLDLDDHRASYHRTAYDVSGAAAAIKAARLPNSLAERLEYGQ